MKRGAHLAKLDDAGRHHARIEAKKLRYAAEGFMGLYPARKTRRFLDRLKALQDELGALNDIATAEPMIGRLALTQDAAFAAGELAGLRAAGRPARLDHAVKAFHRLAEAEPFFVS
jgi:CHAD domain-containing protein